MTQKTVAAVTVGRADYGILRPVLRAIGDSPALQLQLIVAGGGQPERDGFAIAARVDATPPGDTPQAIAEAVGRATVGFAEVYAELKPDVLLLAGDRFETLAAASAAVPFTIPIAHLHGGELTRGATDEQIRHAITKLSHLHFVCTKRHAARVVQMGEEPWRVTVAGAASLDNLRSLELLPRVALEKILGVSLEPAPLLVTYHPATLEYERTAEHVDELVAALDAFGEPIVITAPNVDTSNAVIRDRLNRFAASRSNVVAVENLGTQAYFSMMATAAVMVGNSSSGIIEAATFRLPVVNIGRRQDGRDRSANIIDVDAERTSIIRGIRRALDPAFRVGLEQLRNAYGDGHAAERIVGVLSRVAFDSRLMTKRFYEPSRVDSAALEDQRVV